MSERVRLLLGVDNHQRAGNSESVILDAARDFSGHARPGASWDAALDVVPRAIPRAS